MKKEGEKLENIENKALNKGKSAFKNLFGSNNTVNPDAGEETNAQ